MATIIGPAVDYSEPTRFLPTRCGSAPLYRPFFNPGDVPIQDPRWARLDDLRALSWSRGMWYQEIRCYEYGGGSDELDAQIRRHEEWNRCFEAELAKAKSGI